MLPKKNKEDDFVDVKVDDRCLLAAWRTWILPSIWPTTWYIGLFLENLLYFSVEHQFDDLGGEHLKIVPFTVESLLCLTRVGGFNIIMLDLVVT
jgi:hypothetical protein